MREILHKGVKKHGETPASDCITTDSMHTDAEEDAIARIAARVAIQALTPVEMAVDRALGLWDDLVLERSALVVPSR